MESDKCISTSSAATAENQLTINDLDDDSLGLIFNKLPYIDRTRIESICERWCAVSDINWCTYSKCLTIDEDLLQSYDNTAEKKNILERIMQQSGPYLEEINFKSDRSFCQRFKMGTIKWIAKLCPKLNRLNTSSLRLNKDDWLVCSNLEALSFSSIASPTEKHNFSVLFQRNKRLRRLEINGACLRTSDFYYLDPGQLEFLQIEYCDYFELTEEVVAKLAKSLVELRYSTSFCSTRSLQHLGKLVNLRYLSLKVRMEWLNIQFIADIAEHCRKIERLFLAISTMHAYDPDVFAPLFDLPYLKRLVIVDENNVPSENQRDRLLQRATHLEFFVIDTCDECIDESFDCCSQHPRGWTLVTQA